MYILRVLPWALAMGPLDSGAVCSMSPGLCICNGNMKIPYVGSILGAHVMHCRYMPSSLSTYASDAHKFCELVTYEPDRPLVGRPYGTTNGTTLYRRTGHPTTTFTNQSPLCVRFLR